MVLKLLRCTLLTSATRYSSSALLGDWDMSDGLNLLRNTCAFWRDSKYIIWWYLTILSNWIYMDIVVTRSTMSATTVECWAGVGPNERIFSFGLWVTMYEQIEFVSASLNRLQWFVCYWVFSLTKLGRQIVYCGLCWCNCLLYAKTQHKSNITVCQFTLLWLPCSSWQLFVIFRTGCQQLQFHTQNEWRTSGWWLKSNLSNEKNLVV